MLSTAFLANLQKKEHYQKTCQCDCGDTTSLPSGVRNSVVIFMLLVVIDLLLLIYALYCLFDLKLQWYYTALIIILMFTPGIGFVVELGVIMYHTFGRNGGKAPKELKGAFRSFN